MPRFTREHARTLFAVALTWLVAGGTPAASAQPTITERHRADANRLIDAALRDSAGYSRSRVQGGEGEADVGPILQRGVPGLGLDVDDSKYFWYHHTQADMMTVIDGDDFNKCIATMAVLAYILADLDQSVPR